MLGQVEQKLLITFTLGNTMLPWLASELRSGLQHLLPSYAC